MVFSILSLIIYYVSAKLSLLFIEPGQVHPKLVIILISIGYTTFFIGSRFLIETGFMGDFGATFARGNYHIIGLILLIFPMFILLDFSHLLLNITQLVSKNEYISDIKQVLAHKNVIAGCAMFTVILWGVGLYNFHKEIAVNYITLQSSKVSKSQTFIHITDLQLGSTSPAHVVKVRDAVNRVTNELAQKDIMVSAILNSGDQIDSSSYNYEDLVPLGIEQTNNLPQFFSLGNHEFYHQTPRILRQLDQLGIQVLRKEHAQLDQFNIIGIDDEKIQQIFDNPELISKDKFNILMYHRPDLPENLEELGIDLVLCGHTHGGQMFPYSLGLKLFFNAPQGLSTLGKAFVYVSDGIGLWGPVMRLGTRNEFAVITIEPTA